MHLQHPYSLPGPGSGPGSTSRTLITIQHLPAHIARLEEEELRVRVRQKSEFSGFCAERSAQGQKRTAVI